MPRFFPQRPALGTLLLFALIYAAWSGPPAQAQAPATHGLILRGVMTGGARGYLSNSWATLQVELANVSAQPRNARVIAIYATRPDVQYGRDVWVPAHSTLTTWLPIGPPPLHSDQHHAVEVQTMLFDRTDGQPVLQLPSSTERVRSQILPYRQREPATTVFLDPIPDATSVTPDTDFEEVVGVARVFRHTVGLSEPVGIVRGPALPPTAEALAGIDHIVLASRALANEPPGPQLVRRWLEQGGKLWVMLDRSDANLLARLLGEAAAPSVVDRTSLTTVTIKDAAGNLLDSREHDRPIDFVRVLTGPSDTVLQTVNGWPAVFTRWVGRGELICTTLGARAWSRPRNPTDPPCSYAAFPDLPVPLPPLEQVAHELQPTATPAVFNLRSFAPLVGDDIGYALMGPGSAALVFGIFLLAVLFLGMVLRRSRRPELLGWLGPAAALAAGAVFVVLGERSRRSVPPTVAAATIIDATTGEPEQPVRGLLGVYRPGAGLLQAGSDKGGMLRLDMAGTQGRNHQHLATDTDAWHWENLALPAGARLGTFEATLRTSRPIAARAHFRERGVEGTVSAGPVHGLTDAVLLSPTGRHFPVQVGADGHFRAKPPEQRSDQYLSAAVLSDQQQRRQAIYRHLLGESCPAHLRERSVLLGWADSAELPFTFGAGTRSVGSTLLIMPLVLERPASGHEITLPAAFLPCRRILQGKANSQPLTQSSERASQRLRFQLPRTLLPLEVEHARLSVRAKATARRVVLAGFDQGKRVELQRVDDPQQLLHFDFSRKDLLRLDSRGGLVLELSVSDLLRPIASARIGKDDVWTLTDLGLEVTGRVPDGR